MDHTPAVHPVPGGLAVAREVEVDLSADEAWELLATADGWRRWLVDDAQIDVAPGAAGWVDDDGERRRVCIDTIDEGRGVTFLWSSGDDAVARVELRLEQTASGRVRVRITEEVLTPALCAACPYRDDSRWDLRACLLCLAAEPCRA